MSHAANYRPEVDGLRSVAVLSVMVFHAWPHVLPGGFAGVDIFFVISGFLISTIIWRELQAGTFTLIGFYERRVRRIFPALFTMLAATFTISFWLMSPGMLEDLSQSILATTLFLSNFYFDAKVGYFEPRAEYMPLLHTWSLAVEEQYYIFFPIILMLVATWRPKTLPIVLWSLLVLSMVRAFGFSDGNEKSETFFYLPGRGWELLAGALLAIHWPQVKSALGSQIVLRAVLELLGLTGIIWGFVSLDAGSVIPGPQLLPVVGGTVLLIAAMGQRTPVTMMLASPLAVGLGLLSYSAYLWHQPLFAIGRSTFGHLPISVMLGLFILTFVLAFVSWRFIERPFRSRHFGSQKQIISGALIIMAVFGVLGAAGHLAKGFPQRFSQDQQALAATMYVSPYRTTCHREGANYVSPAQACIYMDGNISNATPAWAVMGDSHGVELSFAMSQSAPFAGIGIAHMTFSGCPPLLQYDYVNPGCLSWTRETLAFLAEHPTITDVVLIYRHEFYLSGSQLVSYPDPIGSPPRFLKDQPVADVIRAYWVEYEKIVSTLEAAGKTVHLMQPVPELPKLMEQLIFSRFDAGIVSGSSSDFYQRRHAQSRAAFAESGRTMIPLFDVMCSSGTCLAETEGQALYFDDNHLSLPGVAWVLQGLQKQGYLLPKGAVQ